MEGKLQEVIVLDSAFTLRPDRPDEWSNKVTYINILYHQTETKFWCDLQARDII